MKRPLKTSWVRVVPSVFVAVCFCFFGSINLRTIVVRPTSRNSSLSQPPLQGDAPNSSVCRRALTRATSYAAKCNVSKDFSGCRFDSGFISYLTFTYCDFSSPILPTIIMVFWLITLLGAFAVIADSFFSPSLIALARSMRMSQNLAGVTLLAFGNGAPDVFSAITAITTGDPEAPDEGLGLGFLMGSGLLVNTVTAGLIMIIHPFRTTRRPYIKDTVFYMSAVAWCAVILVRRTIYISDSIGFICLYIFYVVTTWLAGRVRVNNSNTKFYRRCSALFHKLGTRLRLFCHCICPFGVSNGDSDPSSCEISRGETTFNTRTTSTNLDISDRSRKSEQTCFCLPVKQCNMKIHKNSDSKNFDRTPESSRTVDNIENGYYTPVDETKYKADDVKIIGFRSKPRHGASLRMDHGNQSKPCITLTAPDQETVILSNSSRSAPNRCLLHSNLPSPKRHASPTASLTDRHSNSFRHSPNPNISSPGQLRRASQIGPINASMQKRSMTMGVGFKSRNASINQRRGSRRMSGMDQLPFVVRWIIANKEAEEKELGEDHSGYASGADDRSKNTAILHPDHAIGHRYRHTSDSTQVPDISSIRTLAPDASSVLTLAQGSSPFSSQSQTFLRSPAISFVNSLSPMPPSDTSGSHLTVSNFQNLKRASSLSLPDLTKVLDASKDHSATLSYPASKHAVQFEAEDDSIEAEIDLFEKEPSAIIRWASKGQWHHLAYSLVPVDIVEWHQLSIGMRFLQVLQAPLVIPFLLSIPIVYEELEEPPKDFEIEVGTKSSNSAESNQPSSTNSSNRSAGEQGNGEDNGENESSSEPPTVILDFDHLHGWCRLLNCFQCLLTPMLWVILITVGGTSLGLHPVGNSGLPVVVIVLLISTGLSITILVTSRWDRPPSPYHRPFFASLGFITSVVWIYAIAHELVNSLETLGIVWEISEAILGISVMAFASSISDLMSNSLLAHNGYPRIAFAACIGSPLFNLLIGAGVSYTIKLGRSGDHNAAMSFTLTHALLFTFLLTVLTCNLTVAILCKFEMRKLYGIVLILAYCTFLLLAILIEADVIGSPPTWRLLTGTE